MSFHDASASARDHSPSPSSLAAFPRTTGRKPSKANLLLAHREFFDHLRWDLRLAETYPQLKLSIDGDEKFDAYLDGLLTTTPIDRAITAIVQSLPDIVAAVSPTSIRLRAQGEAALYTKHGRDRMLRLVRLDIRRRMNRAIKNGFSGLEALGDGTRSYRVGFFYDGDFTVDEYEEFEKICGLPEPIEPEEPSPPPLKLVKQAVRFICSPRVPFEIVIADRHPLTFTVKGGQTFKAYIAGKRLSSEAEVARTVVAEAIDRLVPQFDEAVLRDFFPKATAITLTAPPMRAFILKKVREAIDTAVARGGYAGLVQLKDWRDRVIEVGEAVSGVATSEGHEPNEIDELLEGIEPPEGWDRDWA
jgi:hypothetical protein